MTEAADAAPAPAALEQYRRALARHWHPVLVASELGEGPVGVELLGQPLALCRFADGLACFDDVCRHLGASLSLGRVVEGSGLRCAYHGWRYERSGRCVDIPARRGLPIPREARVRAHPVEERYGLVWVCLDEKPAAGIPDFPEASDPAFHLTPWQVYEPWAASAPRVVMGALDDTHFAWVHPGLLGDEAHPEPPDHDAHREGDYLVASYSTLQPANQSIGGSGGGPETVTYVNRCTPASIRLLKSGPAGRYVIFDVASPLGPLRSRVFQRLARDFDTDPDRDRDYMEFEARIMEQDRPVVESQRPWLLPPLSSRLTLYVRPADLPLVAYQRWLEELGIPAL